MLSLCLLFLLLQNIQSFPLSVNSYLPVPFLAFPASPHAATFTFTAPHKGLGKTLCHECAGTPAEDRSSGQVLSYESTQLEKSAAPTEVFLLSHAVTRGQSGSPVLALDSSAVVGLVEGRWLRAPSVSVAKSSPLSTSVPGAAIPIRYPIALLRRQSISTLPPFPALPAR